MNKAYRLIWSKAKDAWVIVAEIVKGNGGPPPLTVSAVMVAAAMALAAGRAQALPVAPTVVNGTASFSTVGNTLTVTNSPNSIINWQAFSIAAAETTRFNQQSALSAVLNRVTGVDPSQILGTLSSNGKVFLINPNGIIFGQGSRIDAAGLVASSLGISNSDFLAGNYRFSAGATAGAVKNQGEITTTTGGMVWLISPNVENSGVITAPNGSVMLAAGQSVNMVDPQRPEIAVVVSAPADQAVNMGSILTQGGSAGIFGSLVNQQGLVSADAAVAGPGGRIYLKSTTSTTLGAGSVTSANALDNGDGGKIVVWSDGHTQAAGSLSSKGGANGGNGGFIETSGKTIDFSALNVNASAPKGKSGLWLIDPVDLAIDTTEAGSIQTALSGADVIVTTADCPAYGACSGTGNPGNITLLDTSGGISWVTPQHLTLRAGNNININAPIVATDQAAILTLDAPGTTTQKAPITAANLELLQGTFTLTDPANLIGTLAGTVTAATLVNNRTLTVGAIGDSIGLTASGNINLTATGQTGQNGIVVNNPISAANITLTGTGGDGFGYSGGNNYYQGTNGGNGVVLNASVAANAGNISITGTGGKGGDVYANNNYGNYNARGGNGGIGINISASGIISASGSVVLNGTGGDGGYAKIVSNYGGNASGGNGGHGVGINAPITSGGFTSITGIGGFGGTATGGNTSLNGYAYNAGEGIGGYGGTGVILKSNIIATGAITIVATGRKGGDGIDGYGGFYYAPAYARGGAGGHGFLFDSASYGGTISSGGNITITGIGGDGGEAVGSNSPGSSNNFGGSANGGNAGYGIRVNFGGYLSGQNTIITNGAGKTITLTGTGGNGGKATGGFSAGAYTGGSATGGEGGHGIVTNGQIINADAGGSVTLTGIGKMGGGAYAGLSEAGVTYGGYGRSGQGGIGVDVSSNAYITSIGSLSISGTGGLGGVATGHTYSSGNNGLGVNISTYQARLTAANPSIATSGGLSLYHSGSNAMAVTGTISISNSGSGDLSFTDSAYGGSISLSNSAAGGSVNLSTGTSGALQVAGITSSNGPVTISSGNDVIFNGAVNAGTGAVSVTSAGAINGQPGVSSINAGSAALTAANGIGTASTPLVTTVGNLSATNNSSGDINISNTGTLNVAGITNNAGSITLDNVGGVTVTGNIAANSGSSTSNVSITAHSPLTINSGVLVSAGGSVYLTAGANGTLLDNLLINGNVTSYLQNIILQGGNFVTVNGSLYAPNGTISIRDFLNPLSLSQMASLLPGVNEALNYGVSVMGRESTDLTEEETSTEGGQNGTEFKSIPYCN